jgi:spore coat protein U-like protein
MPAPHRGRTPDDKPGDRTVAMLDTVWAGACACALLFASAASAATRTSAFRVTATVASSCRIDAPAFATTAAAIHILCTSRAPYAVAFQAMPDARGAPSPRRFLVLVTY